MSGCCTQFSPSPGNTATWARLSALTTLDSIPRLTFIQQVNLAFAAAFSPNAARPPLYADLPFVKSDSTFRLVKPVYAKWVEHAPYDMVPRYRDKLRQLRGFVFDVGTSDTLVPLSSQAVMDSALTRAGVAHTYETYDGDHVNRVGLRMVTRVLPFFSRTLDFGPH
jgi:S-formylglutathione hydrolase FrmB